MMTRTEIKELKEQQEAASEKEEKEVRIMKTILVSEEIHGWLTSLKIIKEEPYESVMQRIREKIKED